MSHKPPAANACRITVAIIATDEHDSLATTLATARTLADEVVLVDAGVAAKSIDATYARSAIVVKQDWQQDYSALRNAALERATGDWVLWLEPGEQMAADAAAALREFAQAQAKPTSVYMLVVTVPPSPGDISGEQVAQIRLVPRDHRLRYHGRVREQLKPTPQEIGFSVEGLPWRIKRGPRASDPQTKARQAERRLAIVERDLAERGPLGRLLVAKGESLLLMGQHAAAAKVFRQATAVAEARSSTQREGYYGLLTSYTSPADRSQQVTVCLEALEHFPLDAQLLCAMGGYMQAEGRLDLSAQAYQTAVDHGQIDPEVWHVHDIHEIAAICLSLTCQLRGEEEECRGVLEHLLARRPEAHRVRRFLIEQHIRHDRRAEALAEFDHLPADLPHREALKGAIRGACLAAKRQWVPAAAYLQTAYATGCRDVLLLRWLALALVATGQHEAALPVLDQWLAQEPHSPDALGQRAAVQAALAGAAATPASGVPAPARPIPAPITMTAGHAAHSLPSSSA